MEYDPSFILIGWSHFLVKRNYIWSTRFMFQIETELRLRPWIWIKHLVICLWLKPVNCCMPLRRFLREHAVRLLEARFLHCFCKIAEPCTPSNNFYLVSIASHVSFFILVMQILSLVCHLSWVKKTYVWEAYWVTEFTILRTVSSLLHCKYSYKHNDIKVQA